MNVKQTVVSLLAMIFVVGAHGAPAPGKEVPLNNLMATATANVINHLETVDGYTKWISARLNESEINHLKEYMSQMGLKPETKFPKMLTEKNKVYFDKNHYMIYNDDSVSVNGKKFTYSDEPFDVVVKEINETIGGKKSSMLEILPKAHAMTDTMSTILSLLGGGALGAGLSPSLGMTPMNGAILGGALGIVAKYGLQYAGANVAFSGLQTQSNYYCCRNYPGQFCCNSNTSQSNIAFLGGLGQTEQVIPYQVALSMNGGYLPPCNSQSLPWASQRYASWNTQRTAWRPPPQGAKLISPGTNSIVY